MDESILVLKTVTVARRFLSAHGTKLNPFLKRRHDGIDPFLSYIKTYRKETFGEA